jgi:hypothetical protein
MNDKIKKLDQTKSLLTQALGAALAAMPNNRAVAEATGDIRRAINRIDGVAKEQMQRKKMSQSQFETWWGNIQSGTANQAATPMSAEACHKSLNQLNGMIAKEQSKIDELEIKSIQPEKNTPDQLLQD